MRTNGFSTEHILLNSRIHFPDQKLPVSSKYLKNFGLRFKCCQKLARISFTPPHGWTWPISTRKTARLGLVHATEPLKGSWVIKESWLLLWRCYFSGAVLGLGKAECGLATGRTKLFGVVLVSRAQFLAPFPVIFSLPHLPPSLLLSCCEGFMEAQPILVPCLAVQSCEPKQIWLLFWLPRHRYRHSHSNHHIYSLHYTEGNWLRQEYFPLFFSYSWAWLPIVSVLVKCHSNLIVLCHLSFSLKLTHLISVSC